MSNGNGVSAFKLSPRQNQVRVDESLFIFKTENRK